MSKGMLYEILIMLEGEINIVEKEIEITPTDVIYPLGKLVALLKVRSQIQDLLMQASESACEEGEEKE